MAIRVTPFDLDHNYKEQVSASSIVEAFDYVIKMKRRGVNIAATSNSYGTAAYSQAVKDAIDAAGNEGILNVMAAGNNTMNNDQITLYLASYNSPSIISVAASTPDDALADFSNFGKSTVHLTAPSPDILTTHVPDFGGTSAAAPQVAGAVALLKSALPTASANEIKAALLGSVDQPSALRGQVMSNGRLNVAKALRRLTNASAPAIVIAAHPAGARTRATDPIRITFSRPMNRASVENATGFKPAIPGRFEWDGDDRTVTLVPSAALIHTNYTGTIMGSAADASGATLDGNFNGITQGATTDDFKWNFSFPLSNDDFADALAISGATGTLRGTTRNASPEVEEPDHVGNLLSTTSVWFRWTAPTNGWFSFNTLQSTSFDTLLAIYTGESLGQLKEIASNDDYSGTRSRVSFAAKEGRSYSIAVAGKCSIPLKVYIDSTSMGTFTLNWYPTPPPVITSFSPHCGAPGTVITLSGANFAGVTNVVFYNQRAVFTNQSDTQMTIVVPKLPWSGWPFIQASASHGEAWSKRPFATGNARPIEPRQLEIVFSFVRSDEGEPLLSVDRYGDQYLLVEQTDNLTNPIWTTAELGDRGGFDPNCGSPCGELSWDSLSSTNSMRFYRLRALDPCE